MSKLLMLLKDLLVTGSSHSRSCTRGQDDQVWYGGDLVPVHTHCLAIKLLPFTAL